MRFAFGPLPVLELQSNKRPHKAAADQARKAMRRRLCGLERLEDRSCPSDLPIVHVDGPVTIHEDQTAPFTVSLSQASTQQVVVGYQTIGYSATAGVDFGYAEGTITFAPGATAATLSIDVFADTEADNNEGFSVVITSATNAETDPYGGGYVMVLDGAAGSGGECAASGGAITLCYAHAAAGEGRSTGADGRGGVRN